MGFSQFRVHLDRSEPFGFRFRQPVLPQECAAEREQDFRWGLEWRFDRRLVAFDGLELLLELRVAKRQTGAGSLVVHAGYRVAQFSNLLVSQLLGVDAFRLTERIDRPARLDPGLF